MISYISYMENSYINGDKSSNLEEPY